MCLAAWRTRAYIADMHTFRIVNVFTIGTDKILLHSQCARFTVAMPGAASMR